MTSDAFFRLTVEAVFYIRGRGTVVTGQVEAGSLQLGDQLRLSRPGTAHRAVTVAVIEKYREKLTRAQPGDEIGVVLGGQDQQDVRRGDVLLGT
jgi:translation elongation factor EF-Tu-like GTPase